jgi:uncharacterized protein (TIGR02268 family)
MIPPSPLSLLVLVLLQGFPAVATCQDVQRIELSRSSLEPREICVSPGLLTGLRFETPIVVDLQDEVRFEEVVRGDRLLTLIPPPNMEPGERLRLTVRFVDGTAPRSATLTLVAHRGQATRQVEVYRDRRTRESYEQELDQELAKNQWLREANRQLRASLDEVRELRGLILHTRVKRAGVRFMKFNPAMIERPEGLLALRGGGIYRLEENIGLEVLLENSSLDPWMVAGASLVGASGKEMRELKLLQKEAIPPKGIASVIVEAHVTANESRALLLTLWDAGARAITLPQLFLSSYMLAEQ